MHFTEEDLAQLPPFVAEELQKTYRIELSDGSEGRGFDQDQEWVLKTEELYLNTYEPLEFVTILDMTKPGSLWMRGARVREKEPYWLAMGGESGSLSSTVLAFKKIQNHEPEGETDADAWLLQWQEEPGFDDGNTSVTALQIRVLVLSEEIERQYKEYSSIVQSCASWPQELRPAGISRYQFGACSRVL